MKFHPYAEVFPLLEGSEFDALVEDIKAFGLREKIWTYGGKILDGRNRFLACQRAKVKPETKPFKGTDMGALAFVVSANMRRRHLNEGQRSMAGARITFFQEETSKTSENKGSAQGGVSIDTAAKSLNVSPSGIKRGRKVLEKGSKSLQKAVDAGDVSVTKAAAVVHLPKSDQLAAATAKSAEPERPDISEQEEEAALAAAEQELATSLEKILAADDRLAAAYAEIKRQAAEIASLKLSRDGFMNGKAEMTRLLKREQAKNERLIKENESLLRDKRAA